MQIQNQVSLLVSLNMTSGIKGLVVEIGQFEHTDLYIAPLVGLVGAD